MRRIHPLTAGASVGIVAATGHLVWVTLVGVGWAKPFLDFVLTLHFIQLQYALAPYAATTAAMLIAVTFALGFLFGVLFALVWNWLASGAEQSATRREPAASLERAWR